jgi:hypothetical protein
LVIATIRLAFDFSIKRKARLATSANLALLVILS